MDKRYKTLLISNSIIYLSVGIFLPFYYVYIQNFGGGVEQFAYLMATMMGAQALAHFFFGKIADRVNRFNFYIVNNLLLAGSIILFLFAKTAIHFYILQIFHGMCVAIFTSLETSLLGDNTREESRGKGVGNYFALMGLITALMTAGAGYFLGEIETIFYISSGLIALTTVFVKMNTWVINRWFLQNAKDTP